MRRRVAEKVIRNILLGRLGYRPVTLDRALTCPNARRWKDADLYQMGVGCCAHIDVRDSHLKAQVQQQP